VVDRHLLHELIEQLPESELAAALRFLEVLARRDSGEMVDEQTAAEIRSSLADPRPDISHEELWARLDQECADCSGRCFEA
jgi:hypothetical protein